MNTDPEIDVQYFPATGQWVKPGHAAVVDIVVVDSDGKTTGQCLHAHNLDATVPVQINGTGCALVITHLAPETTPTPPPPPPQPALFQPPGITEYPVVHPASLTTLAVP